MSDDGLKKLPSDWFTFENRCLVCGRKLEPGSDTTQKMQHLGAHVAAGVMVKEAGEYRQVKAHPVGFPGILLPKEMVWAS